jgi:predicted PurR-regulated permease PerM
MPEDTRKQRREEAASSRRVLRTVLITLGIIGIGFIALYLLHNFATTLLVLFGGILFGILLDGAAELVRRWMRLPHWAALTLVIVVLVGSVALFGWVNGPRIVHQAEQLGEQLPKSADVIRSWLRQTEVGKAILSAIPSASSIHLSLEGVIGPVSQVFSILTEIVAAILIVFFVGLYLAAEPDVYSAGVLALLSPEHRLRGKEVILAVRKALRWWLLGQAFTMSVLGTLTTIALWLLNIPLALVLGIIAGLFLFVPYLGAVAAAIPACLIALMESPMKAVWVALVYTGIHVLEGYTITPFVQKHAVELPPALLLSVQVLSGTFFGLLGIIFSTPLVVVIIVLVQTLYLQDVLGEKVAVLGDHAEGDVDLGRGQT